MMSNKIILFVVFFIAFFYMYFFTSGVPFFWDDHEFHQGFYERSLKDTVLALFSPNESALDTSRPVYGLLLKSLFFFFKFNFEMYRLVKALIFAATISAAFMLSSRFISSLKLRLLFTAIVTFSFPIYIHTLVFDEPFIIAELFKLTAIFLFLKDVENKQSSIKTQLFIFLLTLIAIRTYNPSASLILLLFVFVVFFNFNRIKRYSILLFSLLLISFPYNRIVSLNFSGPHGTNFGNLYKFFIEGSGNYIFSPIINLGDLYYKPAIATLTFFGFWMMIFIVFYLVKSERKAVNKNDAFLLIWFIAEIPLLISLPEHAIRYLSAFVIPFFLLSFSLVEGVYKNLGKNLRVFVFILAIGIIVTNLAYISAFRIGWGGSFIANEKALEFIESQEYKNFTAMYFAMSAGYEFVPLIKNVSGYKIDFPLKFVITANTSHFYEEYLSHLTNEKIYVIQKKSANSRTVLPPVDFSNRSDLKLIKTFNGNGNTFLDLVYSAVSRRILGKIYYSATEVYERRV